MTEIGKEAKLIAYDTILHIENPKHAMRKLLILDLNNEFGKSAGYEINKQNLLLFYIQKSKYWKEKLKKQFHVPTTTQSKKCIEDLYRHYSKEDKMAKKYAKRCSASLNIRTYK